MLAPNAVLSDEDVAVAYRAMRCTMTPLGTDSLVRRKLVDEMAPLLAAKAGYRLGHVYSIQRDTPALFGASEAPGHRGGSHVCTELQAHQDMLLVSHFPPPSPPPMRPAELSNVGLFFHGTPPESLFGVLSRGLQMPRTAVQQSLSEGKPTPLRLGQGIYFAKDPLTSLKYTSSTRTGRAYLLVAGKRSATWHAVADACARHRMAFFPPFPFSLFPFISSLAPRISQRTMIIYCSLCLPPEVARGRAFETSNDMPQLKAPPPGYDSVHALAKAADPASRFEADEYVVYNVAQQRVKFVVELILPDQPAPSDVNGQHAPKPASRAASLRRARPGSSSSSVSGSVRHRKPVVLDAPLAEHGSATPTPKQPMLRPARPEKPAPPEVPQPRGKPLGKRQRFSEAQGQLKGRAWAEPLSHNTALVLRCEGELGEAIDVIRRKHDAKHVDIWPPHITLLYPFVQPRETEAAAAQLREALVDVPALALELARVGTFNQGSRGYLHFLAPEPAASVRQLHEQICAALDGCFGSAKALTTPHLTIARGQRTSLEEALQSQWQPRSFHPVSLVVLQRPALGQPMAEVARVPLNDTVQRIALAPPPPDDWLLRASAGGTCDNDKDAADDLYVC